jgi:tRNA(Ile)-lysidine synthase
LAVLDGKSILAKDNLALKPLLYLYEQDVPSANNLMRYWLKVNDLAMPSQERLNSWWRDLGAVKSDAQLEWSHDGKLIYLWRGHLQVVSQAQGEWVFKAIPGGSKKLGLATPWINEAKEKGLILAKPRTGSEKLQVKPNSPRRSIKNLYQEAAIPPWERNIPLLCVGKELIAIAGVGVSYPHLVGSGPRVWPEWVKKAQRA